MSGVIHNIKCWPDVFEEMRAGRKTAEFRYNDRGYKAGDLLLIREWDTSTSAYTHREITRLITHVLDGGFGVPAGYAMLSLSRMTTQQDSADVERLRKEEQFVIRRNGAFFRPNAAGYTNHVIAAGFYTADEAEHYRDVEGVTIEPLCRYREEAERTIASAQRVLAALSLPITQRDEQAKTYDDGVEDAAKIAEGHYADFRCAAPYKIAGRSIATAIRRLSIEQGDQDGGEG